MNCRVGNLSLLVSWSVGELSFVGEFLSASCLSVSGLWAIVVLPNKMKANFHSHCNRNRTIVIYYLKQKSLPA